MRFVLHVLSVVVALCTTKCFGVTIELNNQYGELVSPGYPEPYNDNEDITWVISTETGYQIVIYFTVFDLEDSFDEELGGACVYDYVEVENSGKRERYCGNSRSFPDDAPKSWKRFRSQNNTMTVKFVSDYSNEDPRPLGFHAHYRVEDKDECDEMALEVKNAFEDWDELIYCNHFCVNVPGSYYCTCRHGFELHENGHTCKASCEGQVVTSDEGVIESPDYPKPYSRLTDCDWTITVREGLSLNLQFDPIFEIENHFNYTECLYDYLKVSYADVTEEYCHDVPANGDVIRTNVREASLVFHTDNAIEEKGFKMTFTTTRTRCLTSRDAPSNGNKSLNTKDYYEFEDEIVFECDPGYNMVPQDGRVLTCLSDGSWDKPAPTCQIKSCGPPTHLQAVPNSYIIDVMNFDFTFQDILVVECNEWYHLISGNSEWTCSENAVWVPTSSDDGDDIPVCEPVCGMKNGADRPLLGVMIAGGEIANPHEWPWMVFINFGFHSNVAAIHGTCGGALISPDYVLTAAHCVSADVREYPPDGLRFPNHTHVWLGAHDRLKDRGKNSVARSVRVAEVIMHPDYNKRFWDSDIALLRLDETVIMDSYVRPICLPSSQREINMLNPGSTAGEVAGWGLSTSRRRASYKLRFTELPTVTNDTCWTSFLETAAQLDIRLDSRLTLTENMFCAGYVSGGTGATCEGDSGGPYMLLNDQNRKYYTHGIVSFGVARTPCGQSVSYSVFTKLNTKNLRWIWKNITP